ncbi:glutathione peroxidase [Hamiltosporidium magnivora]|uniref:Glutathione peroxidase n=1 Tax=Hamiltosporidium magnivora TaxID=148818 RepID=A0A4Q9LE84_9MICR|nr:glutathione peroxidase [Hamiltosporidium magnivora]
MNINSIYAFSAKDKKGRTIKFKDFHGKVLVIVNVASMCGLGTKTYQNLADILERYYEDGLRILLFPCNQFLNKGTANLVKIDEQVNEYSERFILFNKIDISGKNTHDLYKYLIEKSPVWFKGVALSNFTKFLVDKDGKILHRYAANEHIKVDDIRLMEALNQTQKYNSV